MSPKILLRKTRGRQQEEWINRTYRRDPSNERHTRSANDRFVAGLYFKYIYILFIAFWNAHIRKVLFQHWYKASMKISWMLYVLPATCGEIKKKWTVIDRGKKTAWCLTVSATALSSLSGIQTAISFEHVHQLKRIRYLSSLFWIINRLMSFKWRDLNI